MPARKTAARHARFVGHAYVPHNRRGTAYLECGCACLIRSSDCAVERGESRTCLPTTARAPRARRLARMGLRARLRGTGARRGAVVGGRRPRAQSARLTGARPGHDGRAHDGCARPLCLHRRRATCHRCQAPFARRHGAAPNGQPQRSGGTAGSSAPPGQPKCCAGQTRAEAAATAPTDSAAAETAPTGTRFRPAGPRGDAPTRQLDLNLRSNTYTHTPTLAERSAGQIDPAPASLRGTGATQVTESRGASGYRARVRTPLGEYCLKRKNPAMQGMSDRPADNTALPTSCD